ncbi:hypothetical protein ACVMB1_000347 [Bradyrhizobium sp. USDA 4504]|nr:hypothetical protein [Bradyrhizobium elkanii]
MITRQIRRIQALEERVAQHLLVEADGVEADENRRAPGNQRPADISYHGVVRRQAGTGQPLDRQGAGAAGRCADHCTLQRAGFRAARARSWRSHRHVDKFQWQEAPIVIYSMTSSHSDARRAWSSYTVRTGSMLRPLRPSVFCVIVASPHLFEAECRTPRQIQLAMLLSYLELSTPFFVHDRAYDLPETAGDFRPFLTI